MRPTEPSSSSAELHAVALRALPAPSILTDAEQRIVFVNEAFEALSGYRLAEVVGRNCRLLQGDDTAREDVTALRLALQEGRAFQGRLLNYRKDGTAFWNSLSVTPIPAEGAVTHFVGVLQDVTDRVDSARAAEILLALAGGLNAALDGTAFARRAAEAVRELGADRSAVAVVDGASGELVLTGGSGWGADDAVPFRSGDRSWPEDAGRSPRLLAPDSASPWERELLRRTGSRALALAPAVVDDEVRALVLAAWDDDPPSGPLPPLLSDGLAGVAALVAAALRRPADPAEQGTDLVPLAADLRDGLERGEVVACFQPQYDARTGALTGYEALARWDYPEHGRLMPDRFIPLAEDGGLVTRLGDRILAQACRFTDGVDAGRGLQMQVNVSAQQLAVPGLAGRIRELLAEYPDRTWSLGIEITESLLITEDATTRTELRRIRDLGVGVSIDDFGSGYSSLSQLRDLPATELKLDRSFVQREDAVGTSLLTAIIALGHALGLVVVGEGVETASQLTTLRGLGCDRLQGLYLSPPLDAEEAAGAPPDIAGLLPAGG